MNALIKRAPVISFFVLTFGLSWLIWLPAILAPTLPFAAQYLIVILGTFMPTVMGFVLSRLVGGRPGVRELWRRFANWRIGIGWYAYALLLPVVLCLVTLGIHIALGGTMPEMTMLKQYGPLFPVVFLQVFLLGGPLQEEFGWRGFALPRLLDRLGNIAGCLTLGVLWALWHVPLFWVSISTQKELPLGWFLLQPIGLTFLMAWMYHHTRGSVLLAMLFHTMTNVSFALLSLSPAAAGSTRPFAIAVSVVMVAGAAVAVPLARGDNRRKIAA